MSYQDNDPTANVINTKATTKSMFTNPPKKDSDNWKPRPKANWVQDPK
jgi:hypothetical protein